VGWLLSILVPTLASARPEEVGLSDFPLTGVIPRGDGSGQVTKYGVTAETVEQVMLAVLRFFNT
jgi:hypothetical protein